jgi:hypothetical protein
MTFPDGHVEPLRPIMVAGPGTAAASYRMRGPVLCFGVVLRAIGWKALIGIPAHKVTDHIIDGEKLFCERAPRLLEQLRDMTELDEMISAIAPQLIMRQEEVKPVPEPHFPFLSAVREWAASEDPTIDALYATIEGIAGSASARSSGCASNISAGRRPSSSASSARSGRRCRSSRARRSPTCSGPSPISRT